MSSTNNTYPASPGFKVIGASADAAEAIAPVAPALRDRALAVIRGEPAGLTADEVAERINHSPLGIRPRIAELNRLGLIRATGERRRNSSGMSATVWTVKAVA